MSGSRKTNPRHIPRTQADCEREYLRGLGDGVHLSRVIMLSVLLDKYGARDYIVDIWHDVEKLSIECKERRVSVYDLERVLLDEYDIDCK